MLESSRQPQGMIPVSEMLIFSDYFDLMCALDQFVRIIVAMDEAMLKYQSKLRKKHDRSNQSKRRNR